MTGSETNSCVKKAFSDSGGVSSFFLTLVWLSLVQLQCHEVRGLWVTVARYFGFFSATPCRTRRRTQAVLVFQEGTVERPPVCFAGAGIKKACFFFLFWETRREKQAGIGSHYGCTIRMCLRPVPTANILTSRRFLSHPAKTYAPQCPTNLYNTLNFNH